MGNAGWSRNAQAFLTGGQGRDEEAVGMLEWVCYVKQKTHQEMTFQRRHR